MIKYEDIKGNAIDNLISELKTVGKAVLNDNIITINQPGDGVTTNDFFTNSTTQLKPRRLHILSSAILTAFPYTQTAL